MRKAFDQFQYNANKTYSVQSVWVSVLCACVFVCVWDPPFPDRPCPDSPSHWPATGVWRPRKHALGPKMGVPRHVAEIIFKAMFSWTFDSSFKGCQDDE